MSMKSQKITIRLTDPEARAVANAAAAAGKTQSDWVRQALRERDQAGAVMRELRPEFQVRHNDLDSKLRLISDQIAALSKIVAEVRK